ncbi:MAG: hypothetical protein WAO74_07695 [Polaribacter sp.]|uniref:CBU_0592 family membrane protein n=1 Tax=Polaribacter sp. TaxID=1920175 RepID=UPI003BB13A21
MNIVDWIGFFGVFQILLAYLLSVIKKIKTDSLAFILLNLSGAIMACIASILIKYIPFVILEGAWALVSFFSLITYQKETKTIQ